MDRHHAGQAVAYALAKLVKERKIERLPAPEDARASWVYRLRQGYSLSAEELQRELGELRPS